MAQLTPAYTATLSPVPVNTLECGREEGGRVCEEDDSEDEELLVLGITNEVYAIDVDFSVVYAMKDYCNYW